MIDERELHEMLERRAGTISATPTDAPLAIRRARRRLVLNAAVGTVVGLVVLVGALAGVRAIQTAEPIPAVPTPTPPGAGEVLTVGSRDLLAHDPDSGEVRKIVDTVTLPERAEGITSAAWSHDRRWVAFRAGGLWVADTIGGAPRQITADLGWSPWEWSPTEDEVVVVIGRDVTLIDAATGRETDLGTVVGQEDQEGYAAHTLVWSPDGTRIAYDGGPGWGSVYSIDVDSGEHTLLVRQPAGTGEIKDIDWSPDGAHLTIAYLDAKYIASHKAELGPVSYKANALYIANADGSDLRLLDHVVASQWPVWIPRLSVGTAWSPDGTRLAYTSFSGPDHQELQVWRGSVDGSAPSLVASRCCVSDGGGAVWSPDGSRIAFETEPPGDLSHHFVVVNADGTGEPGEIDEIMYRSWLGGSYFCYCYG
jgi:Tol biopolymer transport system component